MIVLTATGGIDTVVKAMQAGAQDFFVKPASPERIMVSIRNALQMGDLKGEVDRLNKKASGRISFDDLIGTSPAMARSSGWASGRPSRTIPILILGESGVGKEVIARAVHGGSDRAGKPFVAVNCGAIPENLVELILFGHEKGSFTGATDKHLGKFQEANGGVLFLDEIGELPLDMQVKLLRALQEGEIDPIGSKRPTRVDVRIVSATNRDLAQQVAEGRFREDLYYRLNVFPIEPPPLRERREDIPAWSTTSSAASTSKRASGWWARPPRPWRCCRPTTGRATCASWRTRSIAPSSWPTRPICSPTTSRPISGLNAPALETADAAPRAGEPSPSLLAEIPADSPVRILDERGHLRTLEEIERDLIQLAIEIYSGHMSEVARRLGIGRSTLYRKVREQGLDVALDEAV